MSDAPKPTGVNGDGRDGKGRFGRGNRFASGNPLNKRVQLLRNALLATVKQKDVKEIARALLEKAKGGDVAATKELFDRLLGKPAQALELSGSADLTGIQQVIDIVLEATSDMPLVRERIASKLMERSRG